MDFHRIKNDYLSKALFTLTSGMDYTFKSGHLIGWEYLGDDQNIKEESIINHMQLDTSHHQELMGLTEGYNNTFQFGLHYGYVHSFDNGLLLRGTIGVGRTLVYKSSHTIEYYPVNTSSYAYKRFRTQRSHLGASSWGNYVSGKVDILYPIGEAFLFAGLTSAYGDVTMNNVYAEEFDRSGNIHFAFYQESAKIRRLDFHLGIMLWVK